MFSVIAIEKTQSTKTVFKRSWYGYTKDLVCEELSKVDWSCDRNDPQSYYNWLENEILQVIDNIVPYKPVKPMYSQSAENTMTQRLVWKKRNMLSKWRQNRRLQDKKSVNNLNKEIRKSLYNTKRQSVRRKIVQGNSKTLWDATKIAMDKECTEIPDTIIHGQDIHKGEEIPEAFAKYFKAKVAISPLRTLSSYAYLATYYLGKQLIQTID